MAFVSFTETSLVFICSQNGISRLQPKCQQSYMASEWTQVCRWIC
jgi:hypothetical protein